MSLLKFLIGASGVVIIGILIFSGIVGAIFWPYTINKWLIFSNHLPVVHWYHGFILGFIPGSGQLAFPAAAITWVAMLFLT